MMCTKQPFLHKVQRSVRRSLSTPLDAVTYTHEFLIVSGGIGTLAILLIVSFAGNIDTMSEAIGRINDIKQEALNEKIDVVSAEKIGGNAVFTLTNYGKSDTIIHGIFAGSVTELACTSNNTDPNHFTITAGQILEITCPVHSLVDKLYVVTDTRNILEVRI